MIVRALSSERCIDRLIAVVVSCSLAVGVGFEVLT